MNVIYEPRGRALEYALLACNLYGGRCSHGCAYCYVAGAMRKSRAQWEATPWYVRKDVIKWLERDAERLAGTEERVLLCFHCDPYTPEAANFGVTRQALKVLRSHEVPFQVLTKGGMRAVPDFDLYGPHDAFATTLTYVHAQDVAVHEPMAASPNDRERAIYEAHDRGIQTWVSLEPVLDPRDALLWIQGIHQAVDLFKVGKLNHDPALEKRIDDDFGWALFAWHAMNLCNKFGKPFVFKKDLLEYCDFHIVGAATFDPRKVVRA